MHQGGLERYAICQSASLQHALTNTVRSSPRYGLCRFTLVHELVAKTSCPQLQDKLPPGITLVKADDFREWLMDIRVMDESEFR